MSDRIARIFINSNFRTNILDNHGNFSVDLPLGVLIEAGSHIRVEGFVVSHVWPTLDLQNSHLFVHEVFEGISYRRIVQLTTRKLQYLNPLSRTSDQAQSRYKHQRRVLVCNL